MSVERNICNNLALRKASRNLSVLFNEAIGPCGLRSGQFGILGQAKMLARPTMKALAEELVMDLSALGHTLKPLVRDGYVVLETNPDDRRSKLVTLTPAGETKLAEATALWEDAQRKFEAAFGDAEAKRLRGMLAIVSSGTFSTAFRHASRASK